MDGRDRPPAAGAALRSRLRDMRSEIVGKLSQQFDGGFLALLGSVQSAIGAVDAVPENEVEPAARAVVADDGTAIKLSFYSADGAACGLDLEPVHAVQLAGRLIEAALARMG